MSCAGRNEGTRLKQPHMQSELWEVLNTAQVPGRESSSSQVPVGASESAGGMAAMSPSDLVQSSEP